MRVNVYNEELTDRVEPATKIANGVTFHGIRFFVGPENLHTDNDDDTSAVTFFFGEEHGRNLLRKSLTAALSLLDDERTKF